MNRVLHAVMAYEDLALAKLAKEKWDLMVSTLQYGYEFDLRLWKFDILRIPELRAAAVHDAAKAQLVFVATRGAGELPPEVKAWIEQWLAYENRKGDAARLLMLLSDLPPDKLGTFTISQFAYLQWAARKGSMDFLASTSLASGRRSASSLLACQPKARERVVPTKHLL